MADISFDQITVDPSNGGSVSTAGSNLCGFYLVQGGTASSVSYGGVSFTKIIDILDSSSAAFQIWGAVGLPNGSNTFSHNSSGSRHHFVTYNNVKQTSFPNTYSSSNSAGAALSTGVTTTENNCWVIAFSVSTGGTPITPSNALTTTRSSGPDNIIATADSNGPKATGSHTATITYNSAGSNNAIAAIAIAPAVESGSGYFHMSV